MNLDYSFELNYVNDNLPQRQKSLDRLQLKIIKLDRIRWPHLPGPYALTCNLDEVNNKVLMKSESTSSILDAISSYDMRKILSYRIANYITFMGERRFSLVKAIEEELERASESFRDVTLALTDAKLQKLQKNMRI